MIQVYESYRQANKKTNKDSYIVFKYGNYNKQAQQNINFERTKANTNSSDFSNVSKLFNDSNIKYNYISCEPNNVILNGTYCFLLDKTKSNENETISFWSEQLSNTEGEFEAPFPTIKIYFNNSISIADLTIYFEEISKEFTVYYYLDDTIKQSEQITENTKSNVFIDVANYADTKINRIEIIFKKMVNANRYVKISRIDFGAIKYFYNEDIKEFEIIEELSIDSSELSSNSLNLTIVNKNGKYDILNPTSELKTLIQRQQISAYHNLKVGNNYVEIPLGTFLLKEATTNDTNLNIVAYDSIYFLDNKTYYGSPFYVNSRANKVLEDLFNYFEYTNYVIEDDLSEIALYGFIRNVEFREALRLILEASCCVANVDRYGRIYIFKIKTKTYEQKVNETWEQREEIAQEFSRDIITNDMPNQNLYNNAIEINVYNYDLAEQVSEQELYNSNLESGTYTIEFEKTPVLPSSLKIESYTIADNPVLIKNNAIILQNSATTCIIQVESKSTVIIKGVYIPYQNFTYKSTPQEGTEDYSIETIDNPLISKNAYQYESYQYEKIKEWKLSRRDIKYNFDTNTTPYIELGDTCEYDTNYNEKKPFTVTTISFTNGSKQNIGGE